MSIGEDSIGIGKGESYVDVKFSEEEKGFFGHRTITVKSGEKETKDFYVNTFDILTACYKAEGGGISGFVKGVLAATAALFGLGDTYNNIKTQIVNNLNIRVTAAAARALGKPKEAESSKNEDEQISSGTQHKQKGPQEYESSLEQSGRSTAPPSPMRRPTRPEKQDVEKVEQQTADFRPEPLDVDQLQQNFYEPGEGPFSLSSSSSSVDEKSQHGELEDKQGGLKQEEEQHADVTHQEPQENKSPPKQLDHRTAPPSAMTSPTSSREQFELVEGEQSTKAKPVEEKEAAAEVKLKQKNKAATDIQRVFRGYHDRLVVAGEKNAAVAELEQKQKEMNEKVDGIKTGLAKLGESLQQQFEGEFEAVPTQLQAWREKLTVLEGSITGLPGKIDSELSKKLQELKGKYNSSVERYFSQEKLALTESEVEQRNSEAEGSGLEELLAQAKKESGAIYFNEKVSDLYETTFKDKNTTEATEKTEREGIFGKHQQGLEEIRAKEAAAAAKQKKDQETAAQIGRAIEGLDTSIPSGEVDFTAEKLEKWKKVFQALEGSITGLTGEIESELSKKLQELKDKYESSVKVYFSQKMQAFEKQEVDQRELEAKGSGLEGLFAQSREESGAIRAKEAAAAKLAKEKAAVAETVTQTMKKIDEWKQKPLSSTWLALYKKEYESEIEQGTANLTKAADLWKEAVSAEGNAPEKEKKVELAKAKFEEAFKEFEGYFNSVQRPIERTVTSSSRVTSGRPTQDKQEAKSEVLQAAEPALSSAPQPKFTPEESKVLLRIERMIMDPNALDEETVDREKDIVGQIRSALAKLPETETKTSLQERFDVLEGELNNKLESQAKELEAKAKELKAKQAAEEARIADEEAAKEPSEKIDFYREQLGIRALPKNVSLEELVLALANYPDERSKHIRTQTMPGDKNFEKFKKEIDSLYGPYVEKNKREQLLRQQEIEAAAAKVKKADDAKAEKAKQKEVKEITALKRGIEAAIEETRELFHYGEKKRAVSEEVNKEFEELKSKGEGTTLDLEALKEQREELKKLKVKLERELEAALDSRAGGATFFRADNENKKTKLDTALRMLRS